MAGEPRSGHNDAVRLAESLRAGDVIALTEVYDAYAPFLFDYCHGLLRDRVEAAGALRNCVIAAREHADRLTEPERLRGWLYAIARKECMRRRDSPNRHTGQEAPEADDGLSPEQLERRDERRKLAHSALAALSGRQREAIDLHVRHELDEVDLCGVLGVPLEDVYPLVEQARRDLGAGVRAALIAQSHLGDCPAAAGLADSWPLPPQAAGALVRHVAECQVCGTRELSVPPPDRLLAVLPIAAIPSDLRLTVLTAATDDDRAGNRRAIAAWTEPFDEYGWPLPYESLVTRAKEKPQRRRGPVYAVVGAGVTAVVVLAGALTAFGGEDDGASALPEISAQPSISGASGGPVPTESAPIDPSPTSSSPSPTESSKSPTPSETPSETPSRTPTSEAPPDPPATTDRPERPAPGDLRVSGCSMGRDESCGITIRAVGGSVTWRVTGTSGEVSASGSGRLSPGESATVTVSRPDEWCWGEESGSVSFSPGGSAPVSYC
ncbi:RNA polymerase sigma factor [Actinomadura sp. WMMB 499]|uniref:RNA polymerase sigma factor n=1 Tax=Actinomadura sp. WMMB 499 TaxID=1219491 RepID=UPI0012470EC1|nr:sigma-70 family RNA polymerase sigma factor [Actinomadura sp. WMMB 499]QFG24687.1 sigma-70 family RNA polymerase sigma factor [Actinomadura sp. WMMB 499]